MAEESTIKISPSEKLKDFIREHHKEWEDVPERIKAVSNPNVPVRKRGGKAALSLAVPDPSPFLHVDDMNWLNTQVKKLRENGDQSSGVYLHKLLQGCDIVLPQPPVIERNPELEARVQRLRKEQEDRQYRAMTKNVDTVRMRHPDDSIGYQMKMLNTHIVAIVQFIVSVGAGFTFGFVGVQLMVGPLDFGFRLLLGVACALIIALAEIYFLAKKISEDYDDIPPYPNSPANTAASRAALSTSTSVGGKLHED
ncbi:transmembrane protein 199 [Thrips palmi]|uniref:Transmembrane protein 199 n=1 Tax=Thrips palmi TaxID=161013 RepID=A0A6P9ABU3_THRPL|nr:transmembrane protein 199 [Thrips palmi]